MSGFASLYYTDCRPGQGLQGNAGFQFQAATPGDVATEAMTMVQRSALYEPPASWMQERRPVEEYPRSLSHIADGALVATAAGCYLGQEANGTRQGNQFTHAVVTRHVSDYGLARPAQLWAAQWWAEGPATSTALEPLPVHPTTGPLDIETVRDRVRDTANGDELLVALLSAVHRLGEDTNRRRVVLVAADPEEAACWIAAATLLLPSPKALRTTFKIFVADAQYGRHDIIALHPDWAGRWADTGPGTGLAVFDLERGRHTRVEPTAAARFWVPCFLTEDPYDIVDAVELANQWTPSPGAEPSTADRTVALVVASGTRLTAPQEVADAADWLQTGPEEALRVAREPVLEAVLDGKPDAPILRTLAGAANRLSDGLPQVLAALQTAEIDEVRRQPDGIAALRAVRAHPKLDGFGIGSAATPERQAELEAAVCAAPITHLPALIELAARHRVPLRDAEIAESANAFTEWWLTCTEDDLAPDRWSSHQPLGWVGETLRAKGRPGTEGGRDVDDLVKERWWKPLWSQARDPADPLDGLLYRMAYAKLDDAHRGKVMRQVLEQAADSAGPADVLAWDVLFGRTPPTLVETVAFLTHLRGLGQPVSPDVAVSVCELLDRLPLTGESLRVVRWLPRDLISKEQRRLLRADDRLQEVITGLTAQQAPAEGKIAEVVRDVEGVPGALLGIRADDLATALVDAPLDRAREALVGLPQARAEPLYAALKRRWPEAHREGLTDGEARAMAFAFRLTMSAPGDRDQQSDFEAIRHVLGRRALALRKEDRGRVAGAGGLGSEWAAWLAELEPRGKIRSLLSRSGKHHGKDG